MSSPSRVPASPPNPAFPITARRAASGRRCGRSSSANFSLPPKHAASPGGVFAHIFGCETIRVNSLHGQGILEPGNRVVVEGVAEDGTIEAIRIAGAAGFALGVQWHAEYDPQSNPVNRALFGAFGQALLARKGVA